MLISDKFDIIIRNNQESKIIICGTLSEEKKPA